MERITSLVEKYLERLPFVSVIIESRKEKHRKGIFETIKELIGKMHLMNTTEVFPVIQDIPMFNMVSAILPRNMIEDFGQSHEVRKIYLNQIMSVQNFTSINLPVLDRNGIYKVEKGALGKYQRFTSLYHVKRIVGGFDANNLGFDGSGVTVGVIDTGCQRFHPMLKHVKRDSVRFLDIDANGHGTWCCSAVFGRFAVDAEMSEKVGKAVPCEGIAPNSRGVSIKALGAVIGVGSTSDIIKGIELAVNRYGCEILSMSLGGKCKAERIEDDPYYQVFEKIVNEHDVIPIVAAGNFGPEPHSICSPGVMPQALTVGAYDPVTGRIASFSSRGPTKYGDIKPDCIAPGVQIDGACSGLLDKLGDNNFSGFSPLSGTSMSTPITAGIICCMKQAYEYYLDERFTVDEIKKMLEIMGDEKDNEKGWGPITWKMFVDYMDTEYSIKIR